MPAADEAGEPLPVDPKSDASIPDEPMSSEPVSLGDEEPGVGLTEPLEPDIDGHRGM